MLIKSNKAKVPNDTIHILVLVAGTTDPVNATTAKNKDALSYGKTTQQIAQEEHDDYSQIPVNYWDKKFIEQIKEFDEKYSNLIIYPFHGWSGDNSLSEREKAGQALIDMLVGLNNKESSIIDRYKNESVNLHFLGHSHGGNVINESTKYIDKIGTQWPKKWEIKSLIYLSVPFFEEIHQVKVNETFYHKEAEVLNLHNDFDLTQRMLADFSIETLSHELIKLNTNTLVDSVNELKEQINQLPFNNLSQGFSKLGFLVSPTAEVFKYNYMSYDKGLELYKFTIDNLMIRLKDVLAASIDIIKQLNHQKTYTPQNKKLKDDIEKKEHKIIPDPVAKELISFIETLDADIDKIILGLETVVINNKKNNFSKLEYLSILVKDNKLIPNLIQFLDINEDSLEGSKSSLWNNISKILNHNIKVFDNTYTKPDRQFENTFMEHMITNINITNDDYYSNAPENNNFYKFIGRIESIERGYKNDPSQYNLLDLLFTLISNEKMARDLIVEIPDLIDKIDYAEYIGTGEVDTRLKLFKTLLNNLHGVFNPRYYGMIQDSSHILSPRQEEANKDSNPYNDTLVQGSLAYLLIESHSTSRRWFHLKVEDFLKRVGAQK